VSDSPELVVFAIGLVNFVLKFPDGQVNFFGEFKLQKNSGMSLGAGCWLISLAEKELTTSSNWKQKQRHGGILEMQLSEKAGLTNKKASLSFP